MLGLLRPVILPGLLLVLCGVAYSQVEVSKPRIEVFGGYSYLNARTYERQSFFGAASGVTVNLNKHIGLVADLTVPVAGPSETTLFFPIFPTPPPGGVTIPIFPPTRQEVRTRVSTAMFGPRFFVRRQKVTLFGHVLAGVARESRTYELEENSFREGTSISFADNGLALGVGGGLELNLSSRVGLRVAQVDYVPTRVTGFWEHQFRVQSGVVVRFGQTSR